MTPTALSPMRTLLAGWTVLLVASGVGLSLLWLDRPILGAVLGGACGLLALRVVRVRGWLALPLVLLPPLMLTVQVGGYDTRLRPIGSAVVDTAGLTVRGDLAQAQAAERRGRYSRTAVTHWLAPVVSADWQPGQPVPYWVVRTDAPGVPGPPQGERSWDAPTPRALLAPAGWDERGQAMAAVLAANRGLTPPERVVPIRWTADADAALARARRLLAASLLVALALWTAAVLAAAAVKARRRPG